MAWPIKHLTESDKLAIQKMVDKLENWFLAEGYSQWPSQLCSDTCALLMDELRSELGNYGFRFTIKSGWFQTDEDSSEEGHVWIEIADGTIIDPTAGQFTGGAALGIFAKGDPRYLYKRP